MSSLRSDVTSHGCPGASLVSMHLGLTAGDGYRWPTHPVGQRHTACPSTLTDLEGAAWQQARRTGRRLARNE